MDHEHNLDDTELTLGLPGTAATASTARGNKRASDEMDDNCSSNRGEAKVQVVGWPPVRSYGRRNTTSRRRMAAAESGEEYCTGGMYVKVSMDGAPFLRKIDLKVYKGYKELRVALEDMFNNSFSLGEEYVITFEDKDGDWMMVGDVPFEMFISTCKRLRIMKGSEARG